MTSESPGGAEREKPVQTPIVRAHDRDRQSVAGARIGDMQLGDVQSVSGMYSWRTEGLSRKPDLRADSNQEKNRGCPQQEALGDWLGTGGKAALFGLLQQCSVPVPHLVDGQ